MAAACLNYTSITRFTMGQEALPPTPALLNDCFGSWSWRSCADDTDIVTGGQLAVGTVFSRTLTAQYGDTPLPTYIWDTVEVYAKYRVDDPLKLDHIYLQINDSAGLNFPGVAADDIIPYRLVPNTWKVMGVRKSGTWDGWDDDNLRVTLSFMGTTLPANVGPVTVDVEWFAIKLGDQAG